jgi:hypothetical protein
MGYAAYARKQFQSERLRHLAAASGATVTAAAATTTASAPTASASAAATSASAATATATAAGLTGAGVMGQSAQEFSCRRPRQGQEELPSAPVGLHHHGRNGSTASHSCIKVWL